MLRHIVVVSGVQVSGPIDIRPILTASNSVNQIAPSGPDVRPWGAEPGVGIGNSVIAPEVVMRRILLPADSVK
ncbi:MAG: hypothetical protein ABJC61_00425 [Acidobacteriota bacterium]